VKSGFGSEGRFKSLISLGKYQEDARIGLFTAYFEGDSTDIYDIFS
jgi:hypothetical protein